MKNKSLVLPLIVVGFGRDFTAYAGKSPAARTFSLGGVAPRIAESGPACSRRASQTSLFIAARSLMSNPSFNYLIGQLS